MARNEEMERRLNNWARWRHGMTSGGMGFATVNLQAVASANPRESRIPTDDCEAEETNRGILVLDSALRRTVEVYYLDGGGVKIRAAKLCISEAGMYARIERAHRAMDAWLAERRRVAEEHRLRQLRLQASARP